MIPDRVSVAIVLSALRKVVLISALLLLGWYIWRHSEYISDALVENFACLLILVSLYVAGIALQAISFANFFSSEERKKFSGLLGFWGSATLLGYIAPFAPSVLVRGAFFYKRGIRPSAYAAKTIMWILASLMMAALLAVASLLAVWKGSPLWLLLILPLMLIGIYLMGCIGRLQLLLSRRYSLKWWSRDLALEAMPASMIPLVCVQYLIVASCYVLAFRAINLDLSFAEGILLSVAIILGALLPIFPNGVGIVEALVGGAAAARGAEGAEIGAALLFLRFSHISACLVLMGLAGLISGRRLFSRSPPGNA